MQPDQATFLLSLSLPSLQNEHRITKAVVEAMPADKLDYRPDEFSMSAMQLAMHTTMVELWFIDAVIAGQFPASPQAPPDTVKTPAQLSSWYADAFAARVDAVKRLSGEALTKVVDFRGVIQMPAVTCLTFVMHHTVHHRGQLSVYLRPMGGKVPAIYGESHDSAAAKKAAQV
jgi:uncharacterized damage-inducible protein DinB